MQRANEQFYGFKNKASILSRSLSNKTLGEKPNNKFFLEKNYNAK